MNKKNIDKLFVPTYSRSGAPIIRGKGSWLFDSNGKKYLDFGSGIAVNSLGHNHPVLKKALLKQGGLLLHGSNLYFSQPQIDLAMLLIRHSFGKRVFFCNSGTEANEAAIKFSRKWARKISRNKFHILSFTDGFHGRTYGALSATAQKNFHTEFIPLVKGFHYAPFNDIAAAQKLLQRFNFAAIIVEPLQGEGGINMATKEFITFLRSAADKYQCTLIFDEIQSGMGRTGTLWNYQKYKIKPDIMTLAKPLGGGLPLGAVVTTDDIALSIKPGDHGTTFGGNPVACALGVEMIHIIAEKSFLLSVREKSALLFSKLSSLQKTYSSIETILGAGLLLGVRMHDDPLKLIADCRDAGLLLIKAGHNTIRFIPPLTVGENEINKAVAIFENVLKKHYQ